MQYNRRTLRHGIQPPEYPGYDTAPAEEHSSPTLVPWGSTTTPNPLPRAEEQVMLIWNPLQLLDNTHSQASGSSWEASSSSQLVLSSTSLPPVNMNYSDTTLTEDPPGYLSVRMPIAPVKYSFSPISFNSMILVPPPEAADTRPLYRITVTMNYFMPMSYVTTVLRGASENGEYVGEFEMGISIDNSTVLIRETEYFIKSVLTKDGGSRHAALWIWQRSGKPYLAWDYRGYPATCKLAQKPHTPLATFYPVRTLRVPGQRAILQNLIVESEAHQGYLDDILMAMLIIERKRLLPTEHHLKELFN